jgi:hypothetical protein
MDSSAPIMMRLLHPSRTCIGLMDVDSSQSAA